MRLKILFASTIVVSGCVSGPNNRASINRQQDRENVRKELSTETSLKADRSAISEMRKDIPAEKQRTNDELALFLEMMRQGSEKPDAVRDKFATLLQKTRQSFRDKTQKVRDNFRREETDRREDFLDTQKQKRERFQSGKPKPDETRKFYDRLERDRQVFMAEERDRRASFESEVNAQSKDFDSYMREKSNEFYEQLRVYSKKFSERPKEKNPVTGESVDFHKMDQMSAKPLGTED